MNTEVQPEIDWLDWLEALGATQVDAALSTER